MKKNLLVLSAAALGLAGLASCGNDQTKVEEPKVELVSTLYRGETKRISCDDGTNKNHNTHVYTLELYSDSSYVLTYMQANAVTMLDMSYGRIITSYGTYTEKKTEETQTLTLAVPTRITMAAYSRNNVHTFADTANWNQGNEAEGIEAGLSYKLYDYAELEVYSTVEEFNTVFAKSYTCTVDLTKTTVGMSEVKVTNGSQVAMPLIGVTAA